MAAKKSGARKAGQKKAGKKKAPASEAGAKKASGKKASAKKAASTGEKKSAANKAGSKKSAKKAGAKMGKAAAAEVHMGHIFALRPRVTTAFRPEDLRSAKHQLADELYGSVSEAARTVADKALELLHDGPARTKKGTRSSGRW